MTEDLFVDVPGGEVYVRKWTPCGVENSTPVILLHDSLGSTELWRDFPEKLAFYLSRPVVSYDRLGFGKSSPRYCMPSLDFIREEAEIYFPLVKKALCFDSFVLFGHSVGGGMSVSIAAADKNCSAVITEAAQAFVEDMTIEGVIKTKKDFERPGQMKRLERWHGDKAKWVLDAWTGHWSSRRFASYWSLAPYKEKVTCPVLAVHGADDEYGSVAYPLYISENIGKGSETAILENCGHNPHREKPEKVMELVKVFLEKHHVS